MSDTMKGGCLCGAVRYEATGQPLACVECHCRDCQYSTGGSHAPVALLPADGFKVSKGTPKSYEKVSEKGNHVARYFCGDCGTPLFSKIKETPMFCGVKAGTLDDPKAFKTGMRIWTSSAQPWAHIDEAVPKFDKMPPM